MLNNARITAIWIARPSTYEDDIELQLRYFARAIEAEVLQAQEPIKLLDSVKAFVQDGINDATQCDDADADHDFALCLGKLLDPIYASPQPPAPCPKCDELHSDLVVKQGMLRIARAERDELQAKVAEIESLRMQDAKAYERLDELRNRDADKIAEQAVEIERLTAARADDLVMMATELAAQKNTIAQQAERVAALESDNKAAWATAGGHLAERSEARERIAELEKQCEDQCIACKWPCEHKELSALIEKCRASAENIVRCFEAARAECLDDCLAEQPNDHLGTLHDLITRRLSFAEAFAIESLAAIAAKKGGAK